MALKMYTESVHQDLKVGHCFATLEFKLNAYRNKFTVSLIVKQFNSSISVELRNKMIIRIQGQSKN